MVEEIADIEEVIEAMATELKKSAEIQVVRYEDEEFMGWTLVARRHSRADEMGTVGCIC